MHKKNKFLSILLCLALIMSIIPVGYISASAYVTPSFGGGDGSSTNPYLIEDLEDLEALATYVNADNDNHCKELCFKQTANIEVTADFEPIGKYDGDYYYFNGTYDGDGNEINGTIGAEDKTEQALFGEVGVNGTIKNVINNADVKGGYYVGGVVGYNNGGTIENCQNNGTITGTEEYVGGVVGNNFGTITNCYNTGEVTGTGNSVGGVVGYNGSDTKITNCYNTGTVEVTGNYVGGVVAENYGTIESCYNTGEVTGTGNSVGGVVGGNSYYDDDYIEIEYKGIITNCYNTGEVTGQGNVGGVAGVNEYGAIITNCYYNKDVYTAQDDIDGVIGKTTDEMSTQDFVDLLNGEGTAFSFKDDEDYLYYPYLTVFGEDSAVVSKEKVEYKITQGDNQEVEIGTDGTLAFTCNGDFDKFMDLYFGDTLVDKSNYSAVKGSTKITLNANYVKTLPLGKQTFTLGFVDGYSTVNLEVTQKPVVEDDKTDDTDKPTADANKPSTDDTDKPTTDDNKPSTDDTENPKTDANSNLIFISILALISVAGVYGAKKKLSK